MRNSAEMSSSASVTTALRSLRSTGESGAGRLEPDMVVLTRLHTATALSGNSVPVIFGYRLCFSHYSSPSQAVGYFAL